MMHCFTYYKFGTYEMTKTYRIKMLIKATINARVK